MSGIELDTKPFPTYHEIIIFGFGFSVNDINYGWHKKKLYRLPYSKDGRYYELLELKQQRNTGVLGYFVRRAFLSMKQLELITHKIYQEVSILKSDIPFHSALRPNTLKWRKLF